MGAAKDYTNQEFNGVKVLEFIKVNNHRKRIWKCLCHCGNIFETIGSTVASGHTRSCGCSRIPQMERFYAEYKTHGLSGTKEHVAWKHIKSRVFNENDPDYETYSKLGMSLVWKEDFTLFLEHIGKAPVDENRWSVGRIDNTLGYFPNNVRWELDTQQSKNKGKYRNNTTGVTGVHKYYLHGLLNGYTATWYDLDKKPKSKTFKLSKCDNDEDLAFFLACEKRELEIMKLNLQGAGYSSNHGL